MDLLANQYKCCVTFKSRPLYQYVLQSYGVVAQLPNVYFSCLYHLEQFQLESCPQQADLLAIFFTPDFYEFSRSKHIINSFYGLFQRLTRLKKSLPNKSSAAFAPACQLLQHAIPLMQEILTAPEHDHHRLTKLGLLTEILDHGLQVVNSDHFLMYEAVSLHRAINDLRQQLEGPACVRYKGFASYSTTAGIGGVASIIIALQLLPIATLTASIGLFLGILIASISAYTVLKNILRTETNTEKNSRLLNASVTQLTREGFFKLNLTRTVGEPKLNDEEFVKPDSPSPSYTFGGKQNHQ